MIGLAIGAAVFLIVAALLLLYRLHTLVTAMKHPEEKAGSSMNKTNALILILFLITGLALLFWYSITYFDDYQLPIASEHGVTTDRLFWITVAITGFVFLITQILLFYFSYRYQHSDKRKALFFPENNRLEIIWTILPAIVLTTLVIYGLIVWNKVRSSAPQEAEIVEIMGYQFAWRVRYPGKDGKLGSYDFRKIDATNEFGLDFGDKAAYDDFMPRELHLPKGRPVEFRIRARDVLHSVFAPHFRLKMDAVPGMPTRFWFIPTKTTEDMREETGNPDFNYEIACAEVCGKGHFSMRLLVIVHEPEEYEKWKAEQQPWLSKHPEYMAQVPENLKELAMIKSQVQSISIN